MSLVAHVSYETALNSALLLEAAADVPGVTPQKRRYYRKAAQAFWSIINDTDAIELEGRHVEE